YGNLGMFTGIYMKGGTIFCFGKAGKRCGGEMYDGTIVLMNGFSDDSYILPTFKLNGIFNPTFLRVFLIELKKYGVPVKDEWINGFYERYSGDFATTGKGEIYIFKK
ncbi:MAG: formylmethanofuran dehydrogenase subunit C, partial [Candidatus Altarchaeaceae archaeon]